MDEHEMADLADYSTESLIESFRAGAVYRRSFADEMTRRGLAAEAQRLLDEVA